MTYEQWLEINVPDWRNYRCNGFNDPHEGWHHNYLDWLNTQEEADLDTPSKIIKDTCSEVESIAQGLNEVYITEFQEYYEKNIENLSSFVQERMQALEDYYKLQVGFVVNKESLLEAINNAKDNQVILKYTEEGHSGAGLYVYPANNPWSGYYKVN